MTAVGLTSKQHRLAVSEAQNSYTREHIGIENLLKVMKTKRAVLVDLRPERVYTNGSLPGAVNFSIAELETQRVWLLEQVRRGNTIIFYSFHADHALTQARQLAKTWSVDASIRFYSGGFDEWTDLGLAAWARRPAASSLAMEEQR